MRKASQTFHFFSMYVGVTHQSVLDSTTNLPVQLSDMKGNNRIAWFDYAYDSNANITQILDGTDSGYHLNALSYDGLDRLIGISGNSKAGNASVDYDALGNITQLVTHNRTLNYNYNTTLNRLTSVSSSGAAAKNYSYFNYDARGNITHNSHVGMTYNLANQMTSALGNSYTYDGHNRRVKVAGNGDTRYYLYSQSGQLLFSEENGVQTNYIYLGSKLIAEDSQGVTTFVHSDMLGSPVARTNASGTVQSRRHYKPFGDTYETPSYDIGYTGHKYDDDLGLSYMQARYYDPVIGRFYSNDPIGFRDVHSFNRYAYANNNPYKYVDPDGMAPNRAGVTTIASLRAEIRGYEKSGLKGAAVMSALSRNHGGNANRYLFTDKHGWVDLRHFGKAAEMASSIGSVTTETLGLGNEVAQWATEWGDDYRSGFSPEDISSNAAGAAFGDDYMDGSSSVSQSLDNWLNDAGARDPSDPAAGTSSLPATDPAVKGGANRGSSNISNSNHCPATASNCS